MRGCVDDLVEVAAEVSGDPHAGITLLTDLLVRVSDALVGLGWGVRAEVPLGGDQRGVLRFFKHGGRMGLFVVYDPGAAVVVTPVHEASKGARVHAAAQLDSLLDALVVARDAEQRDIQEACVNAEQFLHRLGALTPGGGAA